MSFLAAFERAHRAGQRAFNEGDFERAFAGLADDAEWHLLPSLFETGVLKGRDAAVRYFESLRDGLDWRVEAVDFTDAGNGRVLVHQRGTGSGRTTRITDTTDFFQLWELREDGQVCRIREFEQREDALRAAGLD